MFGRRVTLTRRYPTSFTLRAHGLNFGLTNAESLQSNTTSSVYAQMGGHAFRQHLLERLTRADYDHVQARAHAALQRLFAGVRTPAPDPAKTTYGDVDFLVHSPFDQQLDDTRMAAALRAIEVVKGSPTSNLLVLIDDREPTRYAQIDVHRCEDEQCWDMVNLMHSYGRLGEHLPLHFAIC